MNSAGQTICLCMIVKNEAAVIRRALDSVRPLIDHWVIVDTGSTDGTQDIIREHMKGVPGSLYERPWKHFAHNRSEALALSRPHADFSLTLDADDSIELPADFVMPELSLDCYSVDIIDGSQRYPRNQLVRNRLEWVYRGVLHEYVYTSEAAQYGHLAIIMRRGHDGARRKSPEVFLRDVAVLEDGLRTEEDPFLRTRYTFYLAQSYRDAGRPLEAIRHYLERAAMGGWQEEVFYSLLQVARLKEALAFADEEVLAAYDAAIAATQTRAEAHYSASRFCRLKSRHARGLAYAQQALGLAYPADSVFGEPWVYQTGLLDEYAVNAYWCGCYPESLDACLKMLATGRVAAHDYDRVVTNARYSLKEITSQQQPPRLGPNGALGLADQHALQPPRPLRSAAAVRPAVQAQVTLGIVARPDDPALPLHLACIEALEWPRAALRLHLVWVLPGAGDAAGSVANAMATPPEVQHAIDRLAAHGADVEAHAAGTEAAAADALLAGLAAQGSDYLLTTTPVILLRPCTLRELVALGLPIVAPLLRALGPTDEVTNFSADVNALGEPLDCSPQQWLLQRWVRGVIEVPAVWGARLIRRDVAPLLRHTDATGRSSELVAADIARRAGVPQYLDNRQVYGYQLDAQAACNTSTLARAQSLICFEIR